MFKRYLIATICTLALCPTSLKSEITSQNIESVIPTFEKFIEQGMKESHVPAVAIAIVHNDEVIYVNGFGYRDVENKQAATPDTVFQIASVSKPLTSTILASLVGKDKIEWESKIENMNPSFRLSDPWVTSQLTVKDLLSHRSGLPDHAGDLLEDLGYPQEEILYRLRYITPLHPFRDYYAYSNSGFSEAAYAVSEALKTPWNQLAEEKLFGPLGMTSTSYSFDAYYTNPKRAINYFIDGDQTTPLANLRTPDAQRPAGGASSSANDIAKWLILQLGGYREKNIVDEKALQATHTPVIVTGVNEQTGLPSFYGMGWDVSLDEEGRNFLKHSGAFYLGVRSQVVLLPQEKLGIAILANASPTGLPEAISKTFFDLLFKGQATEDIVKKYNQLWMEHQVDPQMQYKVPPAIYTPSLPLESYIGKFSNDYFGTLEVKKTGSRFELVIGPKPKIFSLKHLTRDVFIFETEGENRVGETQVIFSLDSNNHVRQVTIDYLNKFGMGTFKPK